MITNKEQYKNKVQDRIRKIIKTLLVKNKEYANDKAPLHNFYEGAKVLRTTPEKVLSAYLTKHLVSYFDMIEDPLAYSEDLWNEKLGDILAYFILVDVLIWEKFETFKDNKLKK